MDPVEFLIETMDGIPASADAAEDRQLMLEALAEWPIEELAQAALWRRQPQVQDKPRLSVLPSTPGAVVDLDRVEF